MSAMAMALVFLALGAGSAGWQLPAWFAEEMSRALPKWEYKVLTKEEVVDLGKNDLTAGLNKLGDESWELVAIETAQVAEPRSRLAPKRVHFYFKRPAKLAAKQRDALKNLVQSAELNVTMWMEWVARMENMTRSGYYTKRELQFDRDQLKAAEAALENARKQLAGAGVESKTPPEKGRKLKKE
jgi:hypothetical protein